MRKDPWFLSNLFNKNFLRFDQGCNCFCKVDWAFNVLHFNLHDVTKSVYLRLVGNNEIVKIMMGIKNKISCGWDDLSP